MAIIKTSALIVRRVEFSETSQIATLFSPDQGRVDCIAKGSRATWQNLNRRAKIEGPLDTLTLNRVVYYEKRGDALHLLSECEIIYTFAEVRRDLARWHTALCVQELLLHAIRPGGGDERLYYAAVRAMAELCSDADPRLVLLDWFARWLVALGREPDVWRCARTGRDLAEHAPAIVSIRDGVGYVREAAPPLLPGGRVEFELDHVLVLRKFLQGVQKPLETVWLPDAVLLPIVQVLQGMIVEVLDRRPVSFKWLRWSSDALAAALTPAAPAAPVASRG